MTGGQSLDRISTIEAMIRSSLILGVLNDSRVCDVWSGAMEQDSDVVSALQVYHKSEKVTTGGTSDWSGMVNSLPKGFHREKR